MLGEADQQTLTDFVEKGSNVRVKNEVHAPGGDPDAERIQRIVLSALGPEPITEPEEVLLIDCVQYRSGRSLNDLVLKRRHRQGALAAVCHLPSVCMSDVMA